MRRLLTAVLLFCGVAGAMQRVAVTCSKGGQTVTVLTYTSTTKVMASYPGCSATVYITGSSPLTKATIYADNLGTALSNPFTTQDATNGAGYFYVADGYYDVQISGGGLSAPYTFGAVNVNDTYVLQTGTGAVPRTKTDKLKDTVNVVDYGAVCDGSTDDSIAFRDAAASGAAHILVPENPFVTCIVENVWPASNQLWTGYAVLQLKANTVSAAALPVFYANTKSNVTFDHLRFDLNQANVVRSTVSGELWLQPTAVSAVNSTNINVTNCRIEHGASYAISFGAVTGGEISGNYLHDVWAGGVRIQSYPANTIGAMSGGITISHNVIKKITKPTPDVDGPGKGIATAYAARITMTGNVIQYVDDGDALTDTEAMGIECFLNTIDSSITGNTIFSQWTISVSGAYNINITGNNLKFTAAGLNALPGATGGSVGNVVQVEINASVNVQIDNNTLFSQSAHAGFGVSIAGQGTACDGISITNNKMYGHVVEVFVFTNNGEDSLLNPPSNNTLGAGYVVNGTVTVSGNQFRNYLYSAILARAAAEFVIGGANSWYSNTGSYGSQGDPKGIVSGSELTVLKISDNSGRTINANYYSLGYNSQLTRISDNVFVGGPLSINGTSTEIVGNHLTGTGSFPAVNWTVGSISGDKLVMRGNDLLNWSYMISGSSLTPNPGQMIDSGNSLTSVAARFGGTINSGNQISDPFRYLTIQPDETPAVTQAAGLQLMLDVDGIFKIRFPTGELVNAIRPDGTLQIQGTGAVIYSYSGTPEGHVTAAVGSYCADTNGGNGYIKTTATGNTGWKLITRAP